jgi:8-oxo-dGTP pyrophosphatase MutT (NUDIX family)
LPHKYRGGGVAVFRLNKGQPDVLLGLRANNPGKGLWTFPGGGAEGRERLSTAAVREFREETGVQLYGRYITKTGLFSIKNIFFEWNTLIIESTQNIAIKNSKGGEFLSLRWVPVSGLANYKLYRWVKNVVDFYLGGKMKAYTAKPPKNEKGILSKPRQVNRAKTIQRESGESLLLDMAEMVLTRIGRDGTKYYQPNYQTGRKKFSTVQSPRYGTGQKISF